MLAVCAQALGLDGAYTELEDPADLIAAIGTSDDPTTPATDRASEIAAFVAATGGDTS